MHLIVKVRGEYCIVPDVQLRDGHQPVVVGNVLPLRQDTGELIDIEPALWYKTLLVDTVLIDCDLQEVKWVNVPRNHGSATGLPSSRSSLLTEPNKVVVITNGNTGVLSERPDISNTFQRLCTEFDGYLPYSSCGVYDFDPAEAFFLELGKVFRKPPFENFCLTALRVLHCYILPHIILKQSDIPLLLKALDKMDSYLKIAESAIDICSKNLESSQISLKMLRSSFTDDFQKEEIVRLYNYDFLRKVSYSLQNDVDSAAVELDEIQDQVNKVKELLDKDEEFQVLKEKREERDSALYKLERIATVRENVRNVVVRPPKTKKKIRSRLKPSKLDCQSKYLNECVILEQKRAELFELNGRKVKIRSVVEAIKSALEDFKTESETVGLDFKVGGNERATDVLDSAELGEEWMTLEEKIVSALNDPLSPPNSLHTSFCSVFTDRVNSTLSEYGILTRELENCEVFIDVKQDFSSVLDLAGAQAKKRRKSRSTSRIIEGLCLYGEDSLLPLKVKCQTFQNELLHHFERMVKCLQSSSRFHAVSEGKLWMCYESQIYPMIMPVLFDLFQEAYRPVASMLSQLLPKLKISDLGITERWLLELTCLDEGNLLDPLISGQCLNTKHPMLSREETYVKRRLSDSSEEEINIDNPTDETPKRLSYELSRQSLHMLYERANTDGQQVQAELELCNDLSFEGYSLSDIEEALEVPGKTVHVQSESENIPNEVLAENTKLKDLTQSKLDTTQSKLYTSDEIPLNTGENTEDLCDSRQIHADSEETFDTIHDQVVLNQVKGTDLVENCLQSSLPKYSFKVAFEPAMDYIRSIKEKLTVISKLKQLTKAFRFIGNKVSQLRSEESLSVNSSRNVIYRPCCDDMISVCIILLTYLTPEEIGTFYTNLNLMSGLMAPCLRNGIHDCTLVNFQGAFQFVINNQVVQHKQNAISKTTGL